MSTILDIEGAFNRTPTQVSCEEAIKQCITKPLVESIKILLHCRHVSATLGNVVISGVVGRLPDRLLSILNVEGVYAQTYADDFLIKINCISIQAQWTVLN